jgi:hypothetical protein
MGVEFWLSDLSEPVIEIVVLHLEIDEWGSNKWAKQIYSMIWPVGRVSFISSAAICEYAAEDVVDGKVAREEGEGSHVISMEQDQSVMGIVQAITGMLTGKLSPHSREGKWIWTLRGGQKGTDCELWPELITRLCSQYGMELEIALPCLQQRTEGD